MSFKWVNEAEVMVILEALTIFFWSFSGRVSERPWLWKSIILILFNGLPLWMASYGNLISLSLKWIVHFLSSVQADFQHVKSSISVMANASANQEIDSNVTFCVNII